MKLKSFFGVDVRVVNDDWIVEKDMFGALGKTREDGQVKGEDRDKVRDILILLGFKPVETFIVPIQLY